MENKAWCCLFLYLGKRIGYSWVRPAAQGANS